MDTTPTIPGLGQPSNDSNAPAVPSNPISNDVATAEASPVTENTRIHDAPQEVPAQAEDKTMSGTPDETSTVGGRSTETSLPIFDVESSEPPQETEVSKDDVQDVKMGGGQDQEHNAALAEAHATEVKSDDVEVAKIEHAQTQQKDAAVEEAAAAKVSDTHDDTEMIDLEPQTQQPTEVKSTPSSPPVTHALEAALEGLLGPAELSTSNDAAPTSGEPVNAPEADIPTTVNKAPTSEIIPSEGEATAVDGAVTVNGSVDVDGALPIEEEADANPEWEVDSSPYESSSSDTSDDSSDDSDVEESGLSIEETARLLMEADGGSDDEIDGARVAKQAATVRTKNEQPDEPLPKPEIIIDAADIMLPLGIVQHIVEGTHVVIEALVNGGEATILDRGTVLCKEDRTVLGVIHDTIATVHKPMYILKASSEEELKKTGLERGVQIWYAKAHAIFVFPSQLKKEKGSDASNLYDEEVGPEEMEYSDDEQEQAHKREKKKNKKQGKGARGNKFSRGDDNESRASVNGDASLRYEEDDDGPYKPLSRPANFGMGLPTLPPAAASQYSPAHGNRGGHQQGRRGDSRGRGGRGRGFNGRGRGGPSQSSPLSTPQTQHNYLPPPPFAANTPPLPVPGQWPFPIPPIPHFGGAAPQNQNAPNPSYPVPNWGAAQSSPFPFTPVPPPNWPNMAQQPAQQPSYSPPTGGYNMPGVQYPPHGPANAAVPPPPPPNYQQQYQNYYNGQPPNGQPQQRWG